MEQDTANKHEFIKRDKNPREKANIFSIIFFGFTLSTFIKGFKKTFNEEDLYQPLETHKSHFLGDKLEAEWIKEQAKENPSLWRALWRIFGCKFIISGFVLLTLQLLRTGQPVILSYILEYYQPDQQTVSVRDVYIFTSMIILNAFLQVLITHTYVLSLKHLGMKVRVACCSLVYRKCLKLSKKSLGKTTIGQMVNLLSNDVNRFDSACMHVHYIFVAPFELVIDIYLLYLFCGYTPFVGVAFVVLFVPIQMYLGKSFSMLRMKTAIKTDERIRLMNEIISGIQVIKMYTWEKPFANLVSKVRLLEMKRIKTTSIIKGVLMSFATFTSKFALFIAVMTYVLLGNIPNAQYVFVTTGFFNLLKQSITKILPKAISQWAEAGVSVKRLQTFLLYDEIYETKEEKSYEHNLTNSVLNNAQNLDVNIEINEASAKWCEDISENTLNKIDLKIGNRELVTVIGSVGSGKTSLLHMILRELPINEGVINSHGKLSYASQEAWLFCGSVRSNILFGQPYDLLRYNEVIEVCALNRDLTLLPHGDKTIIGEKGAMLSGGQRARINLARAVYKEADIYLLDDPLSAVDTHVGKHIFEKCIIGYLKTKTTILVTHQIQYLRETPRIVMLQNGIIAFEGNYSQLSNAAPEFAKILEKSDDGDVGDTKKIKTDVKVIEKNKPEENKEIRSIGRVKNKVYSAYLKAGGNTFVSLSVIVLFILTQLLQSMGDYFLTFWVNTEQVRDEGNTNGNSYLLPRDLCIIIFSVIISLTVIVTITRSLWFYSFCMRASTKLHNNMFQNVVAAPMSFFNQNPSGRILNRFSKDMGTIDDEFPTVVIDTFQIALQVLGITIVTSVINPWLLIATVVILFIFYLLRIVYLKTSRDVIRLEGTTKSPVFTHLNASLQGLTTIRAFGSQETLKNEFDNYQDMHSSAYYLFICTSRAFGFWLDFICVFYIAFVAFSFLILSNEKFGGNVGLAITQALSLTSMFQWGMRQWSEMENQMTSVERIVQYTELEQEKQKIEKPPDTNWPKYGNIEFRSINLSYSPEACVLKNLNITIHAQEKIGIVGRTGAGKTSLITALFQLAPTEGDILIDDMSIGEVPLQSLRSKISIIPQEPVLFSGSLRKNLDPFDEYTDVQLWQALEEVELKQAVKELPAGLQSLISEGGSNFSVGQRQLVCLARAIVRDNKILVLDEATANVDPQTDALIQFTIREKFKDCTVLTIAHRLHTVMDSDKVLVMDAGEVKEFDHPFNLLNNEEGLFYGMVQQTGKSMAEGLFKISQQNYKQKKNV